MKNGCKKQRRRDPVALLNKLATKTFTVFGRDDDEPAEIVDRLIMLARSTR